MKRFLPRILRLWIDDHILFAESSEHRIVAIGLSGLICGSIIWFVVLFSAQILRQLARRSTDTNKPKPFPPNQKSFLKSSSSINFKTINRRQLNRGGVLANTERRTYLRSRHGTVKTSQTSIDMQRQRLTMCPDQIRYAGFNLIQVNLSHNALEIIPDSFVCLRGLRSLRLEYNRLRHLPLCLGSLPALEELNLSNNCFQTFPDCIQFLNKLKNLDLSHNRLVVIPPYQYNRLVKLEVLRLSFNHITNLPLSFSDIILLRILELSHNQLEYLPNIWSALVHLERLDVSHNMLHTLNSQIRYCCSLRVLLLSNNRLRQLPTSLFYLFNLTCLDVSFNRLRFMPKSVLNVFSFAELIVIGNPWIERNLDPEELLFAGVQTFGPHVIYNMRKSRCRQKKWKEMPANPRSLMELTAIVILESVHWREEYLPSSLHEYLLSSDRCIFCSEMVFPPYCCRSIGFVCRDVNLWLPFSDVSCPAMEKCVSGGKVEDDDD